ncbi:MAG: hypothetical protein HY905_19465 [Deltaproteobacteria bacterium]|nr:hypothetical protein [Deltaproteobacteria bacterium]
MRVEGLSRRPAVLESSSFKLALFLGLAVVSCRSVVAPPSGRDAVDLPSGVVVTSPGELLRPDCSRRECPLPDNLIAELEDRMVGRLEGERRMLEARFEQVRSQRDTWVASLRGILAARRSAAEFRREEPVVDGDGSDADLEPDASDAGRSSSGDECAFAASVTLPLEEVVRWLELPLRPAAAASAAARGSGGGGGGDGGARDLGGDGGADGGPARGASSAGIAAAEGPPVREGEWILPVVRMVARLRAGFEAVALVQDDTESMLRALSEAEVRLREAAAAAPCADLRDAIEALSAARPGACPVVEGSAVCRPAPVDVWTGAEFDEVDPADREDVEKLLRSIDELLGPAGEGG